MVQLYNTVQLQYNVREGTREEAYHMLKPVNWNSSYQLDRIQMKKESKLEDINNAEINLIIKQKVI
ncbi:uncharacterized protein DS421_19g653080 [Arachis hypogaea]|uniref:Uncharacterized protein n=1 Tax=Arachis hypogaea TaxID=3818 RepID=A0A6B9V9K7_ARAHY|nr:uncharacterized protein DS421_19g653080 [Arachis hypogaea]